MRPMPLTLAAILAFTAIGILSTVTGGADTPPAKGGSPGGAGGTNAGGVTFSGPYTHDNLTVFLIHGKDRINLKEGGFLTLQEAMEQKKVVVHETSNVSELAIENLGDVPVYVQSGDIVKGGKQDRTIRDDFIAPAKSGRIPIASFCVERGRWERRGDEPAAAFANSGAQLSTKGQKLANRQAMDQSKVWEEVSKSQAQLSKNVGQNVQAGESASSLQLTLENKKLRETTEAYEKALASAPRDKADVIGYAFAINGRINSVELYAASVLFQKMWPKLIRSASVEAVAELQKDKKFDQVTAESIKAFMAEAEAAHANDKKVTDRVDVVTREGKKGVLFETKDKAHNGEWLHRSYVAY